MNTKGNDICNAVNSFFRLPSFCRCTPAPLGGDLTCSIGVGNIISIGASAFVYPCGAPASFGYKAWASFLGISKVCAQQHVSKPRLQWLVLSPIFIVVFAERWKDLDCRVSNQHGHSGCRLQCRHRQTSSARRDFRRDQWRSSWRQTPHRSLRMRWSVEAQEVLVQPDQLFARQSFRGQI
jgi:hypothetical protein